MSGPATPHSADDRQRLVDAHVWAIIRASGGWNARARARLAYYAVSRRVDPARIAAAVRRAAGSAAQSTAAHGGTVHAESTPQGVDAGIQRTASGPFAEQSDLPSHARDAGGTLIAAAALVLGIAIAGALVWVAMVQVVRARQPAADATAATTEGHAGALAAPNGLPKDLAKLREPQPEGVAGTNLPATGRAGSAGSIAVQRPSAGGRTVPAAAAVFPRPPVLVGNLATAVVREGLETLSAEEAALEHAAVRSAPLGDAEQASILRAAEAFLDAWPVLDPARRHAVLSALVRSIARFGTAEREGLEASLAAAKNAKSTSTRDLWRGAAAAGIAAAFEGRSAHGEAETFSAGALAWLHPRSVEIAASASSASPGVAADTCDAWLTALDAAAATGGDEPAQIARDGAILAALDALLRSGAPLDRPGTPADAAGSLLDSLPWSGSTARRDRLIQAWKAWLADAAVPCAALHGATSVLAARRPGTWWDPWLVVDARASMADRAAVGERLAGALTGEGSAAAVAPIALRGLDPELLRRWRAARSALAQRDVPTADAMRVARAAEWMALVEAARFLERGRASDADARLSQLEEPAGLAPDDADRWRDRVAAAEVRTPPADGKLDAELRSRRSLEDRLNVMRSLRTRPIRDLGPQDAQTLAHEALSAPSAQVRSVAQGVIVDVLAQGPQVLSALLGDVAGATSGAEAAQLAASIAGVPVPRGSDTALRAAAALLLTDQLAGLSPSDRHQLDAAARELGLSAAASARLLGGDTVGGMRPEQAMHAWAMARVADAQRTVPTDVLDPILTRAAARRRTAHGAPQGFAADQSLLLELDAAVLMERLPRRRTEILAVQQRAAAARAQAVDVFAQIDANARALADLASLAIGADPGGGA